MTGNGFAYHGLTAETALIIGGKYGDACQDCRAPKPQRAAQRHDRGTHQAPDRDPDQHRTADGTGQPEECRKKPEKDPMIALRRPDKEVPG